MKIPEIVLSKVAIATAILTASAMLAAGCSHGPTPEVGPPHAGTWHAATPPVPKPAAGS